MASVFSPMASVFSFSVTGCDSAVVSSALAVPFVALLAAVFEIWVDLFFVDGDSVSFSAIVLGLGKMFTLFTVETLWYLFARSMMSRIRVSLESSAICSNKRTVCVQFLIRKTYNFIIEIVILTQGQFRRFLRIRVIRFIRHQAINAIIDVIDIENTLQPILTSFPKTFANYSATHPKITLHMWYTENNWKYNEYVFRSHLEISIDVLFWYRKQNQNN